MIRRWQCIGLGLVMGMGLAWPSWAADEQTDLRKDTRDVEQHQGNLTQDEPRSGNTSTTNTRQGPLPPGLEKQGKMPAGLEKHGKTPKGWSQGKASWKHSGQTPGSRPTMGNSEVGGGGHAGHANFGHGHR